MKSETIVGLLLFGVLGALVWYSTRTSVPLAKPQESVVTTEAGEVTPQPGVSNSPKIDGDIWQTPYYLRANYPLIRDAFSVVPSVINKSLPDEFGSQQIPPSW